MCPTRFNGSPLIDSGIHFVAELPTGGSAMDTNHTTRPLEPTDWDFPTLAHVWDHRARAVIAGADAIEALSEADRPRSVAALGERVRGLARGLDDGWLVLTAFFMIDDLYKLYFHEFRWSSGVHDYICATAGVFLQELAKRGFVLHYVVDSVQSEAELDEKLTYIPAVFQAADLMVTGPQLMALELMQRAEQRPRDVTAIQQYREEGHELANHLITRCHHERRSSVYLNLDLDDDTPGLSLDVALSACGAPGTLVVFRDQPPAVGSLAQLAPPPGMTLPELGGQG